MGNISTKPVYLEDKLAEINDSGKLEYRSKALPTWCPGCGYFSISEGVTSALNTLGIKPKDSVVVSGIGCASRFPFFVNAYGFHTLHGRTLPIATGVKTANDKLKVIAVGGDGDGFAIGGGHLSHAARRNVDITYLLFDNGIYGLTKGQTSPTSALGFTTSTTPYENHDKPLNPLMMMLSFGSSWVGQAYAGDPVHLHTMISKAIAHRGFSYLHILSPCVTFDKTHRTYSNLNLQVGAVEGEHDTSDLMAAIALSQQVAEPPLGVFYEEHRPTLADGLNEIIKESSGKRARTMKAAE